MSQFTITGFDACAHMSEETVGADKSAPVAIVMAIGVSAVAGFAYILAITFSIQVSTADFAPVMNGAQHMHGTHAAHKMSCCRLAITFSIQVSTADFAHTTSGAQHMHGTHTVHKL